MIREFHIDACRGEPRGDAWCALLEGLGIDPGRVPSPATVTYDPDERLLTWPQYAVHADGSLVLTADGDDAHRVEVSMRLDEHPAFPEESRDC